MSVVSAIGSWPIAGMLGFAVFAAVAVLCSLHTSLNNDSGLYYIQFMQWINSYPVVPGLANLHDRLGNNLGVNTNDLNGLLFLLIGLGCFDSASRLAKEPTIYDAVWALFPLPFFLLLRFLTSTAPDLPSTLIPLVYFSLLVLAKDRTSLPIIGALIAFAATIKVLSILHIIAISPLLFWVIKRKDWKSVGFAAALSLLIVGPWLGRNVVQTGYLVFPMESIDLISVDWKVPNELAGNARKMVDTHARMGTYDPSDYGKPTSEWIGFWLGVQSKSVLAAVGFGSLLLLLFGCFQCVKKKETDAGLLNIFLGLTVVLSFAFWWNSGPNPRFVYGVVFFFFAYLPALVVSNLNLARWLRFAPLVALLPLLAITRTVLKEPGPKKPTEFSSFDVVGRTIYYPTTTDKCWEHELPCTTEERHDVQFRTKDQGDGFKHAELNSPTQ